MVHGMSCTNLRLSLLSLSIYLESMAYLLSCQQTGIRSIVQRQIIISKWIRLLNNINFFLIKRNVLNCTMISTHCLKCESEFIQLFACYHKSITKNYLRMIFLIQLIYNSFRNLVFLCWVKWGKNDLICKTRLMILWNYFSCIICRNQKTSKKSCILIELSTFALQRLLSLI